MDMSGQDSPPPQPAGIDVGSAQGLQVGEHNTQTNVFQVPRWEALRPRQLPAAVSHFAGRAADLAVLTSLLRGRSATGGTAAIAVIGGTAGVGKTALALYWAHQVVRAFPDGQLYVNLRGFDPGGQVMDPAVAVRGFLDALGVPVERIPAEPDAQAALFRSHLAGRRMLVVLDNARDTAQVHPLLPGAATCQVVVTSRNRLTGLVAADGAHPINLDLLTVDEARELLARRLGPDRVTAEPGAVADIIARCARLPLALAILAARAATYPHLPLAVLAGELRDSADRLDTLTTDDPHTDVRAVFSWSYQELTPEAASLFRLMSLHPGPEVSTAAAVSLAAVPRPQMRALLAELAQTNLIVETAPHRYAFHDLLRVYAAEQVQAAGLGGQGRDVTQRILDHYLHTAYAADRLLDPARDPITLTPPVPGVSPERLVSDEQALAWLTAEQIVLLGAIDHAAAAGFDTHVWQLAWSLFHFLDRGRWHDLVVTQQAAVTAADRLADPSAQARAHRYLGHAYTQLGRFGNAHTQLHLALDISRQTGDLVGQANAHQSLGYLMERQGRYSEALDHDRQGLDLFQAADHRRGQADLLNSVGWLHALLGDHRQALTYCRQALTLHQELGNRYGLADTWDSLGYAHHHLGDHPQAIDCYQHALDLFTDLGYHYYQADTLSHIGDTHHDAGDTDAARDAWQQALSILNQIEHPDAELLRTKLATLQPPGADNADDHDRHPTTGDF